MKRSLVVTSAIASLISGGCSTAPKEAAKEAVVEKFVGPAIPKYQEMAIPADNPMTAAKVELGRQLYYDKRLSGDGSRSCYYCHVKEKGLTDGLPLAIVAYEAKLTRSS